MNELASEAVAQLFFLIETGLWSKQSLTAILT